MKKPVGRPKNTPEKTPQPAPPAMHGTETEQVSIAPAIEPERAEIASSRCFRYSAAFPQGRIFEIGEVIPAGWFDSPAKITG